MCVVTIYSGTWIRITAPTITEDFTSDHTAPYSTHTECKITVQNYLMQHGELLRVFIWCNYGSATESTHHRVHIYRFASVSSELQLYTVGFRMQSSAPRG
jgi:hypothetical protein